MFVLATFTDLAAVETMLVSIPESLGLFAFAVALFSVAVIGRWLLARGEEAREKEEIHKES